MLFHARRYINFGAFSMNYLELARDFARANDETEEAAGFESQILVIGVVMEALTFGLLLTFGGVALKKAFFAVRAVRLNTLGDELKQRVSSLSSPRRTMELIRTRFRSSANDGGRAGGEAPGLENRLSAEVKGAPFETGKGRRRKAGEEEGSFSFSNPMV